MEHWPCLWPIKSFVPQGSVLGFLLFAIYVNDLPDNAKSSLLLFADDTKLYCTIRSRNDVQQLQEDINALYQWTRLWLLSFNISKCKILHIGLDDYPSSYTLNGTVIETVFSMRDLGVQINSSLKFHQHTSITVNKANRVLSVISKSFMHLDVHMLSSLYRFLVQPILECTNLVWGPFFITDQQLIEKVQKRATRLITCLSTLSYPERLRILNLPSLMYRCKRGDMIFMFQLINNLFNIDPSDLLTYLPCIITRGHSHKLYKPLATRLCRCNFFLSGQSMTGMLYQMI